MSNEPGAIFDEEISALPFDGDVKWWSVASVSITKLHARLSFLQGSPIFDARNAKELGDILRPNGAFISTPDKMIALAVIMAQFGAQWNAQWGTPESIETFKAQIGAAVEEGLKTGAAIVEQAESEDTE